jgi:1,2-phenylacetyl-CoA epoxidase PaaB subunit
VSCKLKPAGTQVLQGSVEAASPQEALRLGIERFAQSRKPWVWWVFPAGQVVKSDEADRESWFSPALDKPFRMSTDFKVVSAMRELKTKKGQPAGDGGPHGS